MGKEGVKIEIMDTTLRDGEQTSGVSFVPHEKLMIARLLLEDLKVDRVEVASARVSDGEFEAVKMICDWAPVVVCSIKWKCSALSTGILLSIGFSVPDAV